MTADHSMHRHSDNPEFESASDLLLETPITCPYCWESMDIVIDRSSAAAEYVEDCQVCCQPIVISFTTLADGLDIRVKREND